MTRSRNWRRSRLLAGALSLTMIAAACGGRDDSGGDAGGDSGGDTGGEEAAGGASIVDTSICADYQATAGVTDDTIKLGTSMPQSGPFAVFGGILNGLNAYFDYRNADGGIAGPRTWLKLQPPRSKTPPSSTRRLRPSPCRRSSGPRTQPSRRKSWPSSACSAPMMRSCRPRK